MFTGVTRNEVNISIEPYINKFLEITNKLTQIYNTKCLRARQPCKKKNKQNKSYMHGSYFRDTLPSIYVV